MRVDQPYRHQELYPFTYNIPGKYIELSDELMEAFQMERVFENMPHSFAEQYVAEEDRDAFCQMYYDIDAGESFATCDFRIKGPRVWNRVCVYRTDMNSDTAFAMVQDVTSHYELFINQAKQYQEEEIRRLGRDVEALQLMKAVNNSYDMIISANLSKNTYYMVSYDRYLNQDAEYDGAFDELIEIGTASVPDNHKEAFFHSFSRESLLKAYHEGKKSVYLEHEQYDTEGVPHWIATTVMFTDNPFNDDIMEITISQNIDERLRKEAENQLILKDALLLAEKANDAKSDFLSRMSHDIRTPMNAIIGMTTIASAQIDDKEKVKECLDKIGISSRFLLNLVNDILDLSKIESGKMSLNYESLNFTELLQGLVHGAEELARQKHQTFTYSIGEDVAACYVGDALRLEQICLNLISNAHKFTPEGGAFSLSVSCTEHKEEKDILKLVVEDNGVGIAENFLDKLFEPFEQDDTGNNRKGSGLGLAIVQNILHLMDGNIRVHSTEGKGSKFVIELPLKRVHTEGEAPEVSRASQQKVLDNTVQFAGQRILLVEDNEINQEVAKTILEMHNLVVDVASDGYEAIELFEKAKPGYYLTVFMDIQMPGIDGYETTRRIRKSGHADAASIPIYAMTANAFATDVSAAKQHGMNGHIAKPVDFNVVAQILAGLV